jgi:Tol biopolymer transport system component
MNFRKLFLSGIAITMFSHSFAQVKLPAFGAPPDKPAILGDGVVSTPLNERDFALSPDGTELFFTISTPKSTFQTIVYSKKQASGDWSAPEVASFAGEYTDLEPLFSSDGKTLYFASNRPLTGTDPKDFDIWKITRVGNGWSNPENLGSVINTEGDEFYPSVGKSGNLYWTATYKGGPGREDIWMSEWKNNQYQKAVALDTMVNSKFYEFNAYVDPNEQYILFTSYGRKDDAGGGDLYMSVRDSSGKWKAARNLRDLNSKQLDYCPFVSPDGKVLFFTSDRHQLPTFFHGEKASVRKMKDILNSQLNGNGNIYWVNFETIYKQMKEQVK